MDTLRPDKPLYRRTRGPSDAELRDAARRHLDARNERLAAYEAALLSAQRARPSCSRGLEYDAIIEARLAEVRQRIGTAARPRLKSGWLRAA